MKFDQRPEPLDNLDTPRKPPMNLQVEQGLLGALLLDNSLLDRVEGILDADHFFDALHGEIFRRIGSAVVAGRSATPVTLSPAFNDAEPIRPDLTVPQYLGQLAANTSATSVTIRDYARVIRDASLRRTLITVGEELAAAANDQRSDSTPEQLIERAEASLYAVAPKQVNERASVSFAEAADAAIRDANDAYQRGGGLAGHATGFPAIDNKIGGLRKSNLIIIAGRPGMGKTALATDIAMHIAEAGVAVVFFSLEMSSGQLATRILATEIGVSASQISMGRLMQGDMCALIAAKQKLAAIPLTIDETGGLTMPQLMAKARRYKRRGKADVVIVDYLGLMRGTQGTTGNRVAEVTEITNGLKAMAKEFAVPVIALSQLNRAVETRDNKRPQLSDLRDSGSVEHDADAVLFCYRDEYYVERDKPAYDTAAYADWSAQLHAAAGKAEVIVAKNRHGPIGTVDLVFDAAVTQFRSALSLGAA
jgi:replicative DNA helicase